MFVPNRVSQAVLVATAVAGFVLAAPGWARADSFFDIFTELMANGQVRYDSTGSTRYQGIQTEMVSMSLVSSADPQVGAPSLPDGTFHVDSFFDIEYRIDLDGGGSPPVVDSFFDVFTELSVTPRAPDPNDPPDTQTFDTEMLSMNLTGDLRLVGGPHHGHVTILKISDPTGGGQDQYRVDSFFDIFTELSVDGGQSWHPCQNATRLASSIITPEPSMLTLLLIAGLGATPAAICRWRRNRLPKSNQV